jgi:hypothetical protein
MKKFIYKIVALLIVIIFSAIILDKAYTYIYLNKTPRTRASYLIQNKVNDSLKLYIKYIYIIFKNKSIFGYQEKVGGI